MGWDIKEDGFGVVLSPELPGLIRGHLLSALTGFLEASAMSLGDFMGFLLHPGGAKILKTGRTFLGSRTTNLPIRRRSCAISATCPRQRLCLLSTVR